MQLSFRQDGRHSVSKRNPLLLKPGVSPALMLWMPQNNSPYASAFSNEPIAEVRSWKTAALVTALFVCGTTFLGMLHIVRQFADPAKFENAARPPITNSLPGTHHVSAPASDRMRRQFRPEISIFPVSKHEPGLVGRALGARESHDRARRQVTLRLPPNPIISEHDGMFTGTISDLRPSSSTSLWQSPLTAPAATPWQPPARRYPTPIAHNDHWPSSPRHYSTEEATIAVNATETGSGVNSSEALIADKQTLTGPVPKPERKPKRSSRAKKVLAKKAAGQCWNRIWRC